MSHVIYVSNNRNPLACGKCKTTIAKGAGYRWTKPRYGPRKVRCLKPSCDFRPSDLSSAKTATIHDAIEDARNEIDTAESHDDIQSILQSVADTAREVAQEYQDASDQWAGGNGNAEFQEKADTCESFADECESWSFSGETDEETVRQTVRDDDDNKQDDGEDDDTYAQRIEDLEKEAWEATLTEMREEAGDVLDGFEL